MGAIVTMLGQPQHGREQDYFGTVNNLSELLDNLVTTGAIADYKMFYPIEGQTPWGNGVVSFIEAPTEQLQEVLHSDKFQEILSQAKFVCPTTTQVWGGGTQPEAEAELNRYRTAAQTLGYLRS